MRKLSTNAVAAKLGMRPNTWRAYMVRGHAPEPDGREEISGTPWWFESTIDEWRDNRPGRGARTDLVQH